MKKEYFLKLISRKGFLFTLLGIICFSVLSSVCSVYFLYKDFHGKQDDTLHRICDDTYNDNIGYKSYREFTCFPRIDAVYTWVNGSDPVWFEEMQQYKSQYRKEHNLPDLEEDNSISLNRFRDNEELKYSLRSLEKNAPWINHVYIVTNGQVPEWLDTSNPKVTIVTHKEIFKNPKALPTFSSPSIEMNLHHIRGLSDYFIYFNDDVFLGSPVIPADFMSLEKGQMLYASWEVPECEKLCKYSMLGNNVCDSACNNRACGFDLGDCESVAPVDSSINKQEEALLLAKQEEACNADCPRDLLQNGVCNPECNTSECGWDGGDCGVPGDNVHALRFFCHLEPAMNITSTLLFPRKMQQEADYYVEKEYVIEDTSYCLARVVIPLTSYVVVDFDPVITSHFTILNVDCLEPDVLLSIQYDEEKHSVFLLLKPSVTPLPFTIHLIAMAQTESEDMVILLIDLIRLESVSTNIAYFIKDHVPINYFFRSTPSLNALASMPVIGSSYTLFMFSFEDPMKGTSPSSLSFMNFSRVLRPNTRLSYLNFNQPVDVFLTNPKLLFQNSYNPIIIESSIRNLTLPKTIFVSEGYLHNVIELDPSETDIMNDISMIVTNTFNFNHPKFTSFRRWRQTRKAYLGLSKDVFNVIRNLNQSRTIQTCFDVFDKRDTDFSTGEYLTFWRPIFEYFMVTSKHDELWSLFQSKQTPKINPFSDLETIKTYDSHYINLSESRVILAVPIVEVITCSIDKSKMQPYEQYITQPDPDRKRDYMVNKQGLPLVSFFSSSAVYSLGVTSAVLLYSSKVVSDRFKDAKQFAVQEPRRLRDLTDYNLWDPNDREELNQRNIHHLTDVQKRMELPGRRLGDSYKESLVHTNLQLIKLFGNQKRHVPAHMPHFINKHIMEEIEEKLASYVNDTIFHRFREGNDLQYSFLYFHYLQGKEMNEDGYFERIWKMQIDTNNNGVLDPNEFMTLAAMVYDTDITTQNQEELIECLVPGIVKQQRVYYKNHNLFLHQYFAVNITVAEVKNCSLSYSGIMSAFPFETRFQLTGDTAIAFQMIDDNVENTKLQLNSVRARQSKFVCINDNIRNKTEELDEVIHSFYESFFPIPSAFEKQYGKKRLQLRLNALKEYLGSFKNLPELSFYCLEGVTIICVYCVL